MRRALATEQVRLSIEQRVVIPRTTMLVLESEWDYQRFGLDRRTLAAILTIDAGGIGRIDRDREGPFRRDVIIQRQKGMPPPPRGAMPESAQRREEQLVDQAVGGVETSVEGGVESSASGNAVAEAITVTAAAPASTSARVGPARDAVGMTVQAMPPNVAPPPPPPPPRPSQKQTDANWMRDSRPPASRVAELEKELRANPRDRELYNQLSEAYARRDQWNELRALALRWQPYDAENPQVYEALALADENLGKDDEAARAVASLIEVAPGKPELLQRAGLLLVRLRRASVAEAPLRRAIELRPDRVNTYRHLALMLWMDGRVEEAARVLESATRQNFQQAWYGNVQRVVREELGYVYRAWLARSPERRNEIESRARDHAVDLERRDALRVTLAWETDANDVDLHVVDPRAEECFYGNRRTAGGLELYEDITQGLGPEVIRAQRVQDGVYHVGVRYFAAGPMGVSRGIVVVLRDGGESPSVDIHPFRLVKGGGDIRRVATVRVK